MGNNIKTLLFVSAAIVLAGIAYFTAPQKLNDELFAEQGSEFYPNFKEALKATTLEVVGIDSVKGTIIPFKLSLKDGRWVIPSYSDYPADVKDKMEHTAVRLMGLKRDVLRSTLSADHEALGVVNPEDGKPIGAGIKVSLKDSNGNILCDYIIGNEVKDQPGFRYMRVPGQPKTYAVKSDLQISTTFSDWVETGLLNLTAADAQELIIDDYSITQGKLVQKNGLHLKKDEQMNWNSEKIPEKKELDQQKVNGVISELSTLKLASVRRKPDALIDILSGKSNQLTQEVQSSLQSNGFYLRENGIFGDEGQLVLRKKNGVVYIMIFGVSFNDDSIQLNKDKAADKAVSGRYMFLTVQYDATANPEPKLLEKPKEIKEPTPEKTAEYEKALAAYNKASADHEAWVNTKLAAEKEVADLEKKFNEWYYVIDNESYNKFKVTLETLLRDKTPSTPNNQGAPAGGNGLPFQLPNFNQ